MFDIQNIFSRFNVESDFARARELNTGHINDTFIIETCRKPSYVLQRVNHVVFGDVPSLIKNKIAVSNHLQHKLRHLPKEELQRRVLVFAQTKSKENYYKDKEGNFWNLSYYIDDCVNYETVPNKTIAFEAGRIFGEFLHLTRDFDAEQLVEIIPDFHTMSSRFRQFDEALETAKDTRKALAAGLIEFAYKHRNEMLTLEGLVKENKIPLRLTHADTKISNALFSLDGEALCVIDTDTLMKGIIHYDFGDAVRTICNNAAEDGKDLEDVTFSLEYFRSFSKGFLGPLADDLSSTEVDHLAFSAKAMTFIVGLRMLTDFLNNDVYFRPRYELHNLDRAKNQMKLVQEIADCFVEMQAIVNSEYKSR